MRRIRYQVAASLDGYIAGLAGEYDWIVPDPAIDFEALFAQFDTFLLGRKTFESLPEGEDLSQRGQVLLFLRSLAGSSLPGVEVVSSNVAERLRRLRGEPGKDIWLFGGGELFRSLLALGEVDTVEIAVVPIFLGGGVPLLPSSAERRRLSLAGHRAYPSGIVLLEYTVEGRG